MPNSQCGGICWDAGRNALHAIEIVAFRVYHLIFSSTLTALRAQKHRTAQTGQKQNNNFELFAP